MTADNIKLIGTYAFGLVVLIFTGYMMATGRDVPEFWSNLVALVAGALFLGNGAIKSIRRYKNNRRH